MVAWSIFRAALPQINSSSKRILLTKDLIQTGKYTPIAINLHCQSKILLVIHLLFPKTALLLLRNRVYPSLRICQKYYCFFFLIFLSLLL